MSEAIGESFEVAKGYEPTAETVKTDVIASHVLAVMFNAFLVTFCKTLDRIAPKARMTFGPGVTPRVTLHALAADSVSDGIAWYHVAAGRSSSARRDGYLRACVAQAALLLACGDRKGASLAMQAHGAEAPEGPKPEQWSRALEGATGAIGEAYAAMVTAQDGYAFPFGSRAKKTGATAHRWYAFYTTSEGKEAKLPIPSTWVPDPSRYDPDTDGSDAIADTDDVEIPSNLVLFGITHPVTVKRVLVRK